MMNMTTQPASTVGKRIPVTPPVCTSSTLRLFEAMSTPAAPAVAKNPTM